MKVMRVSRTSWATVVVFAFLITACGDSGGDDSGADSNDGSAVSADSQDSESAGTEPVASIPAGTEPVASIPVGTDLQESIDELTEDLEDQQQAQGGGSATLTVGDQTWTFAPVLCAFGEEMIGQEGAVFILSSIQDGMQMYASVDSFGESISLNDIEDFESPSVSLDAFGNAVISIDGKNISGEAEFVDETSDDFSTMVGTFSATCP
jgi:hypothetical protein